MMRVLFCASLLLAPLAAHAVTIPTVFVGNAGNGNDPFTDNIYGGVGYTFRIGTTEVTNAQYAEFLNAKAADDPLELYNPIMGSATTGGIRRNGSPGSYSYVARDNMGNKPVNNVTWYDAIRFVNWLNNGQGTGDTETGAYTLGPLGAGGVPTNGPSISRNVGATWFLPSENEWYKAAYHQPAAQGGDTDDYWLYPTKSNLAPTVARANSVGDISNPGTNVANYNWGAFWNGFNGNVTTVGSAGLASQSFYGTSDQAGNVWEWNEDLNNGAMRGIRGSSTVYDASLLRSSWRGENAPTDWGYIIGFRVATVPEPSSAVLVIVACGLGCALRKLRPRVSPRFTACLHSVVPMGPVASVERASVFGSLVLDIWPVIW